MKGCLEATLFFISIINLMNPVQITWEVWLKIN